MVVMDDRDLHCVPGICKHKHKLRRYRDGHKFGRKYAMSTLSGDNNGNGPSKNLSSVRFGVDIGGIQYEDGDFGAPDYGSISNVDHTTVDQHAEALDERHHRGSQTHTTVRREMTSQTDRNMRNNADAETMTTDHHVDFANLSVRAARERAKIVAAEEDDAFYDTEEGNNEDRIPLTPDVRRQTGKQPMIPSSNDDPTDLYSDMPGTVYSLGEGSSSNPFPSGLRNTYMQQQDMYTTPGFGTPITEPVAPYAINTLDGRGSRIAPIADSISAINSRVGVLLDTMRSKLNETAGITKTPTSFQSPALAVPIDISDTEKRAIRARADASIDRRLAKMREDRARLRS